MANINLLPWREELREERNKNFYVVIGVVVAVAAACVFGVYRYYDAAAATQNSRNAFLRNQITAMDQKIVEIQELKETRAELVERMELIQRLQGDRPVIVRVFDEIVRSVPEDLYFRELEVEGNKVRISGIASTNNRVSALMRNFDQSEWFRDPSLIKVESKSPGVNEFEIVMTRINPRAEEDDNGGVK
ncbi:MULTISPECIES: PilN domain-containing protein [Thalassolituus]|jgi:type IV pilus assembly protein PilN|uniref:PilN domain-containing protein n=1 Tax=Thalassolituus TaxID=187492 RepID=UPI0007CF4500|nr:MULTISPECIES: PilN domain-containing protein [Thalassolituus]KZZ01089.1 pilus assembly protein PilN [Oleibacter sp. HI0075]MAG42867.1 pilus assembly protein PilN [Oceanospirillaceae bacterium]MEC8908230.1 PilN domain-containing protein [Pseudomonadota bacterium]HCG79077.1 pilus assembly protein PilN [Oceanospirillales bacterium]MAX87736.1 pilus assembly protein PilN [Oceanospirillaceae bacterium]|tara:strand:+ start:1002 stop:1568 length:567 start_codon:yes stop_codon:yes gene_type:complete